MRNLKINFFAVGDSTDINTWSGVPYFLSHALIAHNVDLARFDLEPHEFRSYRYAKYLYHLTHRRQFFHTLINYYLTSHKLAALSRQHGDADLNLFLTFSYSSYRYSHVPVAHYCDRTLEHSLEEAGARPTLAARALCATASPAPRSSMLG